MQGIVVEHRPQSQSTVAHWGGLIAFLITICVVIATQHRITPIVISLASFFSNLGNVLFLVFGCLILIAAAIKSRHKEDLKLVLSSILLVTVLIHAMKLIYGYWLDRPSGSPGGFPSGHAAAAFALAFLLSSKFPKLSFLWYLVAIGISASRVLTGAHYPYQVFTGALVGCCLALYLNERVHPNNRIEDAARRYHWLIMAVPLITAILSFSYESENDALLLPGTVIFFAAGLMLRAWARRHVSLSRSNGSPLATTGPYSILRHPVYLGNVLLCIGITVSTEVIWLLPLTILFGIAAYGMAASSEERELMARCGEDYKAYTERVRRWVPSGKSAFAGKISSRDWISALKAELPLLLFLIPACIKELIS